MEKIMRTHMRKISPARLAAALLLAAACLAFMGCYMPQLGGGGGTARASIGLTRQLPGNVASIALIVSGPGMGTMTSTYTVGTTTATLSVPSGVSRTFTLMANTPSVSLIGTATVDLTPGETTTVNLSPVAGASQIIIPDYNNYQVEQISDMSGTGWKTFTDPLNLLYPYDIDFDDQGRIYIDDYNNRGIVWISDITGTATQLANLATTQITSIAMDRPRGLLYYTGYVSVDESYELRRVILSSGTDEKIDLSSLSIHLTPSLPSSPLGIAVDSDGMVYLATSYYSTPQSAVLKINPEPPATPTLVNQSSTTFYGPNDVLVKDSYVYVSDPGDSYNNPNPTPKIVRLTKSLDFVDSFSGPASDPFRGPERFVAILNKPITVIDEGGTTVDRLVSFSDMTGAGWTTFGSTGSGQDQFQFYNAYAY